MFSYDKGLLRNSNKQVDEKVILKGYDDIHVNFINVRLYLTNICRFMEASKINTDFPVSKV